MYTDDDLNYAVEKNVLTQSSVEEFRRLIAASKGTAAVDEENFKLIGGFNDIFIVIAATLLLFSTLWMLKGINNTLALLVFTALSWWLSEFFVLKRKMALPAIVLLLSFVGGIFSTAMSLLPSVSELAVILAAGSAILAAYVHWLRFKVPITVAAGAAATVGFVVSTILSIFPGINDSMEFILFPCGVATFLFAMYWDASDRSRTSYRSDVAFWLHLLSAPLIIHPVFSSLGILNNNQSMGSVVVVILLYVLMTVVSIAIDRRAFMVSSLVYVLFALSTLIKNYGGVGSSFAFTGAAMGGMLLVLSAFWHRARAYLVSRLPAQFKRYVPAVTTK